MSYLVLARKWRPKTFSDVVGQQHVLRALINGLDQDRLHHAFLFSGTRGVGKTTLSRILAKSLNCEQGVSSTPCGECQSCQEVDAGRFVDLIEVDAASRTKVDDTRELLDNVQYAPSRGRYKVYLIDEVHMLSTSSFNALLKTLEEPPPHVKFLFATTDPQKLPATILSRCLQFNLRRIELEKITAHLATILEKENISFEDKALTALARAADGSMRDALSLLDQAISFGAGNVSVDHVHQMLGTIKQQQLFNILTALIDQDGKALLQQSQDLADQGRNFNLVLNELLGLLQRLATLQAVPELELTDEDDNQQLIDLSSQISPETIQLLYQIVLHGKRDLPFAADPKSGFDMTLLRMLSFQPKKITPSAMNDDVVTPKPVSEQRAAITAPVEPVVQPQAIQEEPEKETYQIQQPAPEAVPQEINADPVQNTALSANNWTSTIASLKLTALSRQLANNSAFIKFDNSKVYLSIAQGVAHLATDKAKERLEAALQQYLNSMVSIVIEQNDEQHQSSQTLATQQAEHKTNRQQQATESIHNDSTVNAIKQTFDGQVIESTIKPID